MLSSLRNAHSPLHRRFGHHVLKGPVLTMLAVAAISTAIPANAADIYSGDTQNVDPAFDPVASSTIWTGAYAGLYGNVNWNTVGVMGNPDVDGTGVGGGAYVGYNQELGNSFVAGIEAMGGYNHFQASHAGISVEQDWEASLRARMGYALEQNLIYGLAGVTATRVEVNDATGGETQWLTGLTVGAGVEHRFTDQITGRVEYNYNHYDERTYDLGGSSPNIDFSGHGVRVGVGMNF